MIFDLVVGRDREKKGLLMKQKRNLILLIFEHNLWFMLLMKYESL